MGWKRQRESACRLSPHVSAPDSGCGLYASWKQNAYGFPDCEPQGAAGCQLRQGHSLPAVAHTQCHHHFRCRQWHWLHHAARARNRPGAHQHHRERHPAERRRVERPLLGQHRRPRLKRAVDAGTAWRRHIHQRRRSLWSHRQHAHRKHWRQALHGARPQRRLLLPPQGTPPPQPRPPGRPQPSSTATSSKGDTSPTTPW